MNVYPINPGIFLQRVSILCKTISRRRKNNGYLELPSWRHFTQLTLMSKLQKRVNCVLACSLYIVSKYLRQQLWWVRFSLKCIAELLCATYFVSEIVPIVTCAWPRTTALNPENWLSYVFQTVGFFLGRNMYFHFLIFVIIWCHWWKLYIFTNMRHLCSRLHNVLTSVRPLSGDFFSARTCVTTRVLPTTFLIWRNSKLVLCALQIESINVYTVLHTTLKHNHTTAIGCKFKFIHTLLFT